MILITGGTGFVGTNLISRLLKDSQRVRCLVRNPGKAERLKEKGVELIRGDVTNPSSVLEAITPEIDTVIHLVGILAEPKGQTFRSIHVEGTRSVVEACKAKGVKRYIHISALGTRKNARSEYHKTKWEAEELVRASGLEYTIFRPSVIFGREDNFTNMFARIIRLSPVIIIPGSGKNRMQPVHVVDVAEAMALSINRAEAKNKTFEVAGPEVFTFDEIMDKICEVLGKKRVKVCIPMPLMRIGAMLAESVLPTPPITRDQLLMLQEDNITSDNALVKVFGMKPKGFVEGMRTYLK